MKTSAGVEIRARWGGIIKSSAGLKEYMPGINLGNKSHPGGSECE